MKKSALVLISSVALVLGAKAQTTTDDRLKPVQGTWGVGFGITGLGNIISSNWQSTGLQSGQIYDPFNVFSPGTTVGDLAPQEMLFGRYYFTDQLVGRVGFGLNSFSDRLTAEDSTGGGNFETTESKVGAFSFGLGLGAEYHCSDNSRRIDPYFGGQLNFGMITPIKGKSTTEGTGNFVYTSEQEYRWGAGSTFSLDFIIGAQIFAAKHWSIGIESNLGWGIMTMGGDYTNTSTITVNNTTTTTETTEFRRTRSSGFRVGNATIIRTAFFF